MCVHMYTDQYLGKQPLHNPYKQAVIISCKTFGLIILIWFVCVHTLGLATAHIHTPTATGRLMCTGFFSPSYSVRDRRSSFKRVRFFSPLWIAQCESLCDQLQITVQEEIRFVCSYALQIHESSVSFICLCGRARTKCQCGNIDSLRTYLLCQTQIVVRS